VLNTLKIAYRDSTANGEWSNVFAENYEPVMKSSAIKKQAMPSVKGMGLKDALYILEGMGMKVNIKGKGKVVSQSVAPGSTISKGATVSLELS
jgi:cell division protein FtsI (penicillin-binding protein 3)